MYWASKTYHLGRIYTLDHDFPSWNTVSFIIPSLGLVAQSVEQRIENVGKRINSPLLIGPKHSKTHCPTSTEFIGSQRFRIFPKWHRQRRVGEIFVFHLELQSSASSFGTFNYDENNYFEFKSNCSLLISSP